MSRRFSQLIAAIVTIGVLIIITLGIFLPAPHQTTQMAPGIGLNKGEKAPNFTITTLVNRKISLSDLRGQVVLLNFWRTDCVSCRAEIPEIQDLYTQYQKEQKNVVILGIHLGGNKEDVQNFQQQEKLTYPLAVDQDTSVSQLYGIRYTPTTYYIDASGTIQQVVEGAVGGQTIKDIITQVTGL